MNIEKFNRTGFRDAYNALKYLQDHESTNIRKGGQTMHDEDQNDQPINPAEEATQAETTARTARSDAQVTNDEPETVTGSDPDLKEPEECSA